MTPTMGRIEKAMRSSMIGVSEVTTNRLRWRAPGARSRCQRERRPTSPTLVVAIIASSYLWRCPTRAHALCPRGALSRRCPTGVCNTPLLAGAELLVDHLVDLVLGLLEPILDRDLMAEDLRGVEGDAGPEPVAVLDGSDPSTVAEIREDRLH